MRATPAADPIDSMLPPVPAVYAINNQNGESVGKPNWSYIPMVAATNGTLSITAETTPMIQAIAVVFLTVSFKKTES